MSKKYYKKGSHKGFVTTLCILGVGLLGVGVVGGLSKGFKDWDYKNWFQQESSDVVEQLNKTTIDFTKNIESDSTQINEVKALTLFNTSTTSEDKVFNSVSFTTTDSINTYLMDGVYRDYSFDVGSLKIGKASSNGYISLDLVEDYVFNHVAIYGRSYSSLSSGVYTSDKGGVSINGSDVQLFNNSEDTSVLNPIECKEFSFTSEQKLLKVISTKRINITKIVLWTELPKVSTSGE